MNNRVKTYIGLGLIVVGVGLARVGFHTNNSTHDFTVNHLDIQSENDVVQNIYNMLKDFKPTFKGNTINLKFNLDKVDGEWQTEEVNVEVKDKTIEIWGDIATNKNKDILRTDPAARVLFELLVGLTNYKVDSYNDYMKELNNKNLGDVKFKYIGNEIIFNLDLNYNK